MKNFTAPVFTFFLAALIIFSSCNDKGGGVTPPPKTKTELITTGTWRFGSANWGGTDAGPMLQACQKDNTMTFSSAGGSGELNEGTTKCDPGDPQTSAFTWAFQSGETVVHFSSPLFTPGGVNDMTLVTLTEVELTLSQPLTVGPTTKTLSVTFIH
jgi:hypothetical protein